jgi:diguanylate cyclase (GGDEF)-like protein/putative nucleotidyltransferase with HDIG domain
MSNIPFLFINVTALSCFALMFVTFLATKKTPEIWAFLAVLLDAILWSGGSILMRMQMWPGLHFWYQVSLVALFSMELLFYIFVYTFARRKGKFLLILFTVWTLATIPGTISGFYLAAPTPVVQANGATVFTYSMNWHIFIPCVMFVTIIGATTVLLLQVMREQGIHAPGIQVIITGGLIMLAGNLLQIGLPGNTFPFDALAGIVFAILLMSALYKRRIFRLTLIVSRSLLTLVLAVICIVSAANFISPLQQFAEGQLGLESNLATMLVAVAFAGVLGISYTLMRKLLNAMFTREEQQNKLIKKFSAVVSQSLSTADIMEKMGSVISSEIPIEQIYICLLDGDKYQGRYCSSPLATLSFSISKDSPQIAYLKEQESYLLLSEFRNSPKYLSVWETEKELFRRLNIDCVAAMRDGEEIVGLVLLSAKERGRNFNAVEIGFLETVTSIASIAMKNAALYEQMFREARIDPLTGVYNYRFFVEKLEEQFRACGKECLTLLYADADDFKLYNQLYGVGEGDAALCRIGEAISRSVGESGTVFRTSGKVFAVLLPRQDTQRSRTLAKEIQERVSEINLVPERRRLKPLSVSIGICSAPYAASSAKELMDNADLAVYNAKQGGKDQIVIFRGASDFVPQQLAERTDAIVDRIERGEGEFRTALSMISALTAAIDAKDHYTYAHSKNVARYAATLAVALGLNDDQVRTIYAAGLLHDIGKISVSENILRKTGKLSDEEYQIMKGHVNNSIEMIRHLPEMDYLIPAVLGHHERWDGKGYPRGIAGEEIPVSARCLAIADVFDAMTTDRPYRKGLSIEYALAELERGSGTQFDPQLTGVFVQLIRSRSIPLSAQAAAICGKS